PCSIIYLSNSLCFSNTFTSSSYFYTLSLHDALPISFSQEMLARLIAQAEAEVRQAKDEYAALLQNNNHRATVQQIRNNYNEFLGDRKSTRLNSSHVSISYAVFCLKKKIPEQIQKTDE